jgi:hypothetical protein
VADSDYIFTDSALENEMNQLPDNPEGIVARYRLLLEFLQEVVNSSSSFISVGNGIDLMRKLGITVNESWRK